MGSKRRSLRSILTLAWLIPGGIAALLSLGAFLTLGWVEYQHALKREIADLDSKSALIARRLAAEVLLGERGSPESVSEVLRAELGLSTVQVASPANTCSPSDLVKPGFCVERIGSSVELTRPLPLVLNPTFVRVSAKAPSYVESLKPSLLLWSVAPIVLLLGMGVIAMQWLFRRYLVGPVEALAHSAARGSEPPAFWPEEFASLSAELRETFVQRDLAMVGQFSSGIIHDLKTSLHSLRTGLDLVRESESESPRRKQCMELLLKSAAHHVPYMESLVSTTLDGTRSIAIHANPADLRSTLQASIEKHTEMLRRYDVHLDVSVNNLPSPISHDPLQMERVFSNVLKNAIEATSESEASSAKRISVRSQTTAESVSILIEDSGPGLKTNPNDLLKSVKSSKVHGSGLGLLVSRKIIEAHQGVIVPGKSKSLSGARFEIKLPVSREVTS